MAWQCRDTINSINSSLDHLHPVPVQDRNAECLACKTTAVLVSNENAQAAVAKRPKAAN